MYSVSSHIKSFLPLICCSVVLSRASSSISAVGGGCTCAEGEELAQQTQQLQCEQASGEGSSRKQSLQQPDTQPEEKVLQRAQTDEPQPHSELTASRCVVLLYLVQMQRLLISLLH